MTRIVAAVAACLLFIAPAAAESVCGPWEDMLAAIAEHDGQFPAFIATSSKGYVVVVTVNKKTGTFTIFGQPNEDTICLLDTGMGWSVAPDEVIENILDKIGDPA